MGKSTFIEELETACNESNVSAGELVKYVIEAKEGHRSSRRAVLGLAGAPGGGLAATGSAMAQPSTDAGEFTGNKVVVETLAGPSADVADLSADILDLSGTEQMIIPQVSGTPSGLQTGSFWLDLSS